MRDEGQKFHDSRTPEEKYEISLSREKCLEYKPSRSSTSSKFIFWEKETRKDFVYEAGCRCRGHVVTLMADKCRQIIPTHTKLSQLALKPNTQCLQDSNREVTTTRHRDHPLLLNLTMFSARHVFVTSFQLRHPCASAGYNLQRPTSWPRNTFYL